MHATLRLAALAAAAILASACVGDPARSTPPLTVGTGDCCGDANTCGSNICQPSLHCGTAQVPRTVFACCENGKICCRSDEDCQGYRRGAACDLARAACFDDCANDDTRCVAGFHCAGSTCVANLPDTTACDEASDCATRNCSTPFDPDAAGSRCAPADTCAAGNQAWAVGYTLCAGQASARRCDASGRWGAPAPNPQPAIETCDAGGGAASGYRLPATCRSGLDDVDPGFATTGCASCAPYRATASGCVADCANDDSRCWGGHHCDVSTCAPDRPDTAACHEASDCTSRNCATPFDPQLAGSVCAPAATCSAASAYWAVGYTLCSGDVYARRCDAAGRWSAATPNPQPAKEPCDAGGGAASGYRPAATCRSGLDGVDPGFLVTTTCVSCAPYRANGSGCLTTCADDDARCASGHHCAAVAGNTCVSNADGSPCDVDGECTSGRCDANTCKARLGSGLECARNADCASGSCSQAFSETRRFCALPAWAAPATCAELKAYLPGIGDGSYRLYAGHDWAKRWPVACVDLATSAPLEYLDVVAVSTTGAAANFSQYTAGGSAPGTNVVTRFTKLRIDPASFVVSTGDLRFATSTGSLVRDGTVTSISYASAADCACSQPTGVGNVDLTGTPFAVKPNDFATLGVSQAGTATYSSGDKVVSLTGGGCCGCMAPINAVGPANGGRGSLDLVYVGP